VRIKKITLSGSRIPGANVIRPFTTPTAKSCIRILENVLCHRDFDHRSTAQLCADELFVSLRDFAGSENFPPTILVELAFSEAAQIPGGSPRSQISNNP